MHPLFDGLAKDLRGAGLEVEVVPDWKTRGRPGLFDPIGVMDHHTASATGSGDHPALGIVTHGRSDLPGPLANFVLARSGKVIIVAAGRCNHAGAGGPLKFIGRDAGNARCVAIEAENNGVGEPWSTKQMGAYVLLNAVLLERLERDHTYTVAHKEYTTRKIDPNFDMATFRKRVRRTMVRLGEKRWQLSAVKVITGRRNARLRARALRRSGWNVVVKPK